jgi:CRP-like cAMP-binding protein
MAEPIQNRILSRLSKADFQLLEPHLESVDLPLRKQLENRGRPIKTVYFLESGFASVVADGGKRPIEVGLIGREGMTGLPVVMGTDRNINEVYMQMKGHGQCLPAAVLRRAIDQSTTLHRAFLRFANSFFEQTTRTAIANGRSKMEERLARWLLMAHDRADGDNLALTHQFIAMMLGAQRPGVSLAIEELERAGIIATKRGCVTVLDRPALRKLSNGTYVEPDGG